MNWANTLRRWTMHSIHAAILGAAVFGSASVAFAQTPGVTAGKLPKQHFTRSQTFDLPVDMPQEYRVQLSEIRLFVKTPTTGWKLAEFQAANATRFTCRVTQDGEYWYSLATVDRQNRQMPLDVSIEPPNQRVVVDTTPPVLQVQHATTAANEPCLRCTVHDANPDFTALKAVCKTDFGEIPLEEVLGQPGVFLIKGNEPLRFPVIISARDMAGNVATKAVNVREMFGAAPPAAKSAEISQIGMRPEVKDPQSLPQRLDTPPVKPDPQAFKNEGNPHRTDFAPPPVVDPIKPPVGDVPTRLPNAPDLPAKTNGPHQLISTTHATVEYRLDSVGASGVGKVELYMTPDNGQTWHRLGENVAKSSPANIKLPGDGVYGIRIVVTNGNGFGGKAPVRGDAPHCTIEVDGTSPFIQLRSAEVLASTGQVELRWNATDKNLGNEPISISYRTRPDAPWTTIAKGIKNEGVYRWAFPRDLGPQIFFRLEVADMAGNIAQHVSPQPIVIDMSEPRPTVINVSGGPR